MSIFMKTRRTFKSGDYCRFTPEEIPTIIALLKANGWKVWDGQNERYTSKHNVIWCDVNGELWSFIDVNSYCKSELSRHDFMVTALRLSEGRLTIMNHEEYFHIRSFLNNLGVENVGIYLGTYNYSEWCKRLNVPPIGMDCVGSIPNVGEKVKTHPDIIKDVLDGMDGIGGIPSNESFYAEFDFRCRAALGIEENKSILTLPDGTTVDLTKPLEVSYGGDKWENDELDFHFVGFNRAGHIIVECLSDCELHEVDKIRNKPEPEPEPEFKEGDGIFYKKYNDWVYEQYNPSVYYFVKIYPAFIDGKPVYPPFD